MTQDTHIMALSCVCLDTNTGHCSTVMHVLGWMTQDMDMGYHGNVTHVLGHGTQGDSSTAICVLRHRTQAIMATSLMCSVRGHRHKTQISR